MSDQADSLQQWISEIAGLIEADASPEPQHFISFLHEPGLVVQLVDIINAMDEAEADEGNSLYSACIFAIDICVAQLQSAQETGYKLGDKVLNQLMHRLALAIRAGRHSLSFWLPVLNAFYDVHVELSSELRDAYLDLAGQDDESVDEEDHLEAIRSMIEELSDMSVFDIADNFFAQSHAMPVEFFADLIIDLCSLNEGHDIALLALLHPKPDVREMVISTLDHLIATITLSSESLTRLSAIKSWYPAACHEHFNHWIKLQRMKGVVFQKAAKAPTIQIKATEVDGTGAQGLFIHVRQGRRNRLCGLLFKEGVGIKDAWITPVMTAAEAKAYYQEAFDETVTVRNVDEDYLTLITNHFLDVTIAQQTMPDLHLLEIQEMTGIHFVPERMDVDSIINELSVQIVPFTQEIVAASFKRSLAWLDDKQFTESWYTENAHIDKLVNRCSSFVNGVRVCNIDEAVNAVFEQELERHRDKWLFHFLWISLWLKSRGRKNEKTWQDSFFIAHAIHSGLSLTEIPVMHEICRQTVVNSIETMNERRTHLSQE
ncbi:hypothetical protein [Legionella sp. CNM-4043-24]|uniref:hypothetical protein n=1 Tax=Legionella sp. CNM-4043-24 TaxID=3421646 RepID=UPI00403AB800